MSLAIVNTRACFGIHAPAVTVEVHLSNGLPSLSIVGLPETAVKESKDRVRSALINSQFSFPPRRITINLAPADLPKDGGRFDLPIAIGILVASEQLPADILENTEFIGELALSGELRPVNGILPAAMACANAKRALIVPNDNTDEACLSEKTVIYPAKHLLDVCAHLRGQPPLDQASLSNNNKSLPIDNDDLSDVIGQSQAKRALEIAAAGKHNLILCGPPGTGKTMLASRLPTIMPPLNQQEALEVACVYSIAKHEFVHRHKPPFRSPHHTSSGVALVGGGSHPKPGEISLAHNGVLFLDEFPEFQRNVIEVLREPLESGEISISRAKAQMTFPANFLLVAAMNPCECGYYGNKDPDLPHCICTPQQLQRYQKKVSGPMLDRFDLQVFVHNVKTTALLNHQKTKNESSAAIRERVLKAHQRQYQRQACANAQLKQQK